MINKEDITDSDKILRLWAHEICWVFKDRLMTDEDEEWFMEMMMWASRDKNREDLERILWKLPFNANQMTKHLMKHVLFADIMGDGVSTHDWNYNEVPDFNQVIEKANSYLDDFNSFSKKPMHLVLFDDAIRHILWIARILRLSKGNALLVGLGGSGR